VIDVLGDLDLAAPPGNVIRDAVRSACRNLSGEFEVIVDYKGANRPTIQNDDHWHLGEWQVQTYAWLRGRQADAKRVAAGALIYINELAPSSSDVGRIRQEVNSGLTDVRPIEGSADDYQLQTWTPGATVALSEEFRLHRAIRVIPISLESIAEATGAFDRLVGEIEYNVLREAALGHIGQAWHPTCHDRKTCSACDFLSFCPRPADGADAGAPVDDNEFA
jgi:hypothetical protein